MEGFEYIRSKSNIEGININALENLLEKNEYNQYSIKKILNGSIVIFDTNKGKICMVNCVKNYYDILKDYDCADIQRELFNEYKDYTCEKCHKQAINLWKQQKLVKK